MGLLVVDNQYLSVAQALVTQAKKEICISTFKLEVTDKPRGRDLLEFFKAIVEKVKSGVKVKVLFNWHEDRRSVAKTNFYSSIFLKSAGCDIRYLRNNRCCHAKLLMVDKEKVLLGSHNLSIRSTQANFELSYLIPDPETVAQVGAVFERLFADAKPL